MRKVPLQPQTNGTNSNPEHLFYTVAFHFRLGGGRSTGSKHCIKPSASPALIFCWKLTPLTLYPPPLTSSPHTFPTKTNTQQSPVEQETIWPFFPYKAKGMGPGGTVRAPHPAGSCGAQAAGGSRLSITSPQGRSPLPCRM